MMASDSACGPPVAYLIFRHADHDNAKGDIPIYANAEFDLGRDEVSCVLGVSDGTISKHHLRFHCVTYGVNDIAPVEPMVYARTLSRHGARFTQKTPDESNSTCFLQSGHSPVLLIHGDILQLSAKISIKYIALPAGTDERTRLGMTAAAEAKSFRNQYSIVPRALGVGGFATVFLAINTKARRQVACKVVRLPKKPPFPSSSDCTSKKGLQSSADADNAHIARYRKKCQDLRREFEVLKGIDHPNIIRLEKTIYATDRIYIFQELISGGDLLSYLERKGGLDEPEAAVVVFQLLKALEYLHSHGIVHRDIKPENILLTSWRKGARIVLTDFGQAKKLVGDGNMAKDARTASRMCTVVGTVGYAAPEVYMRPDDQHANSKSGYNEAVDVWSVGCLAGTLLTNAFLFPRDRTANSHSSGPDDNADLTVAFNLQFLDTSEDWQGASRKSKSFIRGCAMVDDSQRLTVAQALQHPWVAHPSFAAAMHAEYARAIADWTPRANSKDFIEYLKPALPTTETLETGYEVRLHEEVRSHHFRSPTAPVLSQFKTFDASIRSSARQQVRLSPIDYKSKQSHRPVLSLDVATSDAEASQLANAKTNNLHEGEDMSYASIQEYAPPILYKNSVMNTQGGLMPGGWDTRLAQSMDLDGPTVAGNIATFRALA